MVLGLRGGTALRRGGEQADLGYADRARVGGRRRVDRSSARAPTRPSKAARRTDRDGDGRRRYYAISSRSITTSRMSNVSPAGAADRSLAAWTFSSTNAGRPPAGPFENRMTGRPGERRRPHPSERRRDDPPLLLVGMKRARMWGQIINVTSMAAKQPVDHPDSLQQHSSRRCTGFARTLANEVARSSASP